MGDWGARPWDNDAAADWYGQLFISTRLTDHIEKVLQQQLTYERHSEIRAAAALVILLGHIYVYPESQREEHIRLSASKLLEIEQMLRNEYGDASDTDDGIAPLYRMLQAERTVLKERLAGIPSNKYPELLTSWFSQEV